MTERYSLLKPIIKFLASRRRAVTLKDVVGKTGINRKATLRILRKLTRDGYLELTDPGEMLPCVKGGRLAKNPTWKIVDRKSLPKRLERKKNPATTRDRIWKAMRIKRIFLVKDIMKLAEVKKASAMNFIHILLRNGYVRKVGQRGHREGCHWQLIRDDGPDRPALNEYPKHDVTLSL
jgi:Mn-dependent DtxR family transcriptional regulator